MRLSKCPSCGSNINIDENSKTGICPYCNNAYITDELPRVENNTNNSANIINYYYSTPSIQPVQYKITRVQKDERPKINYIIAFFAFACYIFPGVIYVNYIKRKQKEWDDKHKK